MAQLLDLRTSPGMGKLCANRVAFDDVSFEVGYGEVSEVGTVEFISRRRTCRSARLLSRTDVVFGADIRARR
jgi:hypothetical protein